MSIDEIKEFDFLSSQLKSLEEETTSLRNLSTKKRNIIRTLDFQKNQLLEEQKSLDETYDSQKIILKRKSTIVHFSNEDYEKLESSINSLQYRINESKVFLARQFDSFILPQLRFCSLENNLSPREFLQPSKVIRGRIRGKVSFPNKPIKDWKKFEILAWLKGTTLFRTLFSKFKDLNIRNFSQLVHHSEVLGTIEDEENEDRKKTVKKLFDLNVQYLRNCLQENVFYSPQMSKMLFKLARLKQDFLGINGIEILDLSSKLGNKERIKIMLRNPTFSETNGFEKYSSYRVFLLLVDSSVCEQSIGETIMSEISDEVVNDEMTNISEVENTNELNKTNRFYFLRELNMPYYFGIAVGPFFLFFNSHNSTVFTRNIDSEFLVKKFQESSQMFDKYRRKFDVKYIDLKEKVSIEKFESKTDELTDLIFYFNSQWYHENDLNCASFAFEVMDIFDISLGEERIIDPITRTCIKNGVFKKKKIR